MTRRGEPLRWLRAAVQRDTNECIEWPFATNTKGYGKLRVDGHYWGAHRMALILVGQSLTGDACALHACDNPPCVNPRHLSWGTQAENMRQMSERYWALPLAQLIEQAKRRGRSRRG